MKIIAASWHLITNQSSRLVFVFKMFGVQQITLHKTCCRCTVCIQSVEILQNLGVSCKSEHAEGQFSHVMMCYAIILVPLKRQGLRTYVFFNLNDAFYCLLSEHCHCLTKRISINFIKTNLATALWKIIHFSSLTNITVHWDKYHIVNMPLCQDICISAPQFALFSISVQSIDTLLQCP